MGVLWLLIAKKSREQPKDGKGSEENRESRGVMPARDGADTLHGGSPTEEEGAAQVEGERDGDATDDEQQSPKANQTIEFAEESGCHEGAGKRTNAAARILDSDGASEHLDDVTMLQGGDVSPIQ